MKLQADHRTFNPEERVGDGGWVVEQLGMLSSYSNNLRNFYWNKKFRVVKSHSPFLPSVREYS